MCPGEKDKFMSELILDPVVFDEIKDLMDDALGAFIETYLDNSPKLLAGIRQGLTDGNMDLLITQAHQLRGGSGSMGAMQVFQLASQIEEQARAGETDKLESLLEELHLAYEQAAQELKVYL